MCQVPDVRDGVSWYTDCMLSHVSFTSFEFMPGRDLEANAIAQLVFPIMIRPAPVLI